jgi:hypothetical protein
MRTEKRIGVKVIRERNRQLRIIRLLQPERVVPHERTDTLTPDKLRHKSPYGSANTISPGW